MTEPKTIRVWRNPVCSNRYDSEDGKVGVYVTGGPYFDREELDITITIPKSREERLREARLEALNKTFTGLRVYPREALAVIERVDAEFAKGEGDGG